MIGFHPEKQRFGFTLTEVILAISVMAVALPLILSVVVAGGESSRQAERETRAVMTARSVFEEVRRALNNNSALIARTDLPWGTEAVNSVGTGGVGGASSAAAEEGGEWLIFELNRDGEIIGRATDMKYEESWRGENADVTALAAVRGYGEEVEGPSLTVFRIEVRVESPARAAAQYRDREVFIKTDSLR